MEIERTVPTRSEAFPEDLWADEAPVASRRSLPALLLLALGWIAGIVPGLSVWRG